MAIRLDEKNLKSGLLGLVVALVEIIQELLERQALRRIEGGSLSDMEVERLGESLCELSSGSGEDKGGQRYRGCCAVCPRRSG